MVKLKLNPPYFPPFVKVGSYQKGLIKPLFGKEGQGEICSANF
jgi:hypothetical protein